MTINNSVNNLFSEQKVVNSAVSYVVLDDDVIINITDTSAPRTVTLPAPSATNTGKFFMIKDTSGAANTNNITVAGASGNIDGAANRIITTDHGSMLVYSDGTNYFVQSEIAPSVTPNFIQVDSTNVETVTGNMTVNTLSAAVTFDTATVQSFGTDITFNNSTGIFTLRANRTYSLRATVPMQGTEVGLFQWVDSTAGAFFGERWDASLSQPQLNVGGPNVIFTPTVDTEVYVQLLQPSSEVIGIINTTRCPTCYIYVI